MLPPGVSIPLLVIGGTVALYWNRVLRMARKQRRQTGKAANLVPPEPLGRVLRILWAPAIVIWVVHPIASAFWERPVAGFRPLADVGWARWVGAAIVVGGYFATRRCWKHMGRNWRMGIDPGERTQLVFDGLFAYVRHPIYTLSAVMMLATAGALPTPVMLAAATVHVALLFWESAREERHLVGVHGPAYEAYRRHVGRIVPRSVRPYTPPAGLS